MLKVRNCSERCRLFSVKPSRTPILYSSLFQILPSSDVAAVIVVTRFRFIVTYSFLLERGRKKLVSVPNCAENL